MTSFNYSIMKLSRAVREPGRSTRGKRKREAQLERTIIMKKVWNVVKNIFTWAVVLIAVGMMIFTIISVNTFDRADRNLFGYKAFIVLSDSMSATDFSAGDLVLVKEVDPATLQEGDIISFSSQNTSNFGEIVTHKIRTVTTDENGDTAFITYGTTTNVDDLPLCDRQIPDQAPRRGQVFHLPQDGPGLYLLYPDAVYRAHHPAADQFHQNLPGL